MSNYFTEKYGSQEDIIKQFGVDETTTESSSATTLVESNPAAVNSYNAIKSDEEIRATALRFAEDHLGFSDLSEEEAIAEFIEHFRSFDVNELTAGRDYNIVSGLVTDAAEEGNIEGSDKARQRLADYTKLYQTYQRLPGAFSEGGAPGATLDYLEGLATAPSTYIGIVPGIFSGGTATVATRAGATAAVQASKQGVKQVLKTLATKPVTSTAAAVARNPIKSTVVAEGLAGAAQNLAAQKTEMEIGEREEFSEAELALMTSISGAPAALVPGILKKKTSEAINRSSKTLLSDVEKAIAKRNEEAVKAAEETFEKNIDAARMADASLRDTPVVVKKRKAPDKKEPLDEFAVSEGKKTAQEIGDALDLGDGITLSLDPGRDKRILAAGVELMARAGITQQPNERFSSALHRAIINANAEDKVLGPDGEEVKFLEDILKKYNLSTDDLLNVKLADLQLAMRSEAGATLGRASGASKKVLKTITDAAAADYFGLTEQTSATLNQIKKSLEDNNVRKALTETGDLKKSVSERIRGVDQFRIAMMTTQTATTFRNVVSGYTRVGADVLTKTFDRAIATGVHAVTLGAGAKDKVKFFDATPNADMTAVIAGLTNTNRSRALREVMRTQFSRRHEQLFRELTDIADMSGKNVVGTKTGALRQVATELNALNTLSDNYFKQASFYGELSRGLNEAASRAKAFDPQGLKLDISNFNLEKILLSGKFNDIFESTIKIGDNVIFDGKAVMDEAIDKTLYFTYQRTPTDPIGKMIINAAHSVPFLTTSLMPFPRFVANALRYTYEYSPLYAFQALGRTMMTKQANYEELAKAATGTAFLAGAIAYRSSEYAGDRWYEGKVYNPFDPENQDGESFDMRPFFPAAPYLFIADMIVRYKRGEPVFGDRSFTRDALQALTGTQFKAGSGFYAVDKALEDMLSDTANLDKATTIGANIVANLTNSFTIPATAFQDMYNTFLAPDEARIVKQTRRRLRDVTTPEGLSDVLFFLAQKSMARLPGNYVIENVLAEKLGVTMNDYYESPTRAQKIRRVTPISRQTMGILMQERRNTFEKELERLKMSNKFVRSSTSVEEADVVLNKFMGEYITNVIVPYMDSKRYKGMNDDQKQVELRALIKDYKSKIVSTVEAHNRDTAEEKYGFDVFAKKKFESSGISKYFKQLAVDAFEARHGKDAPKNYKTILQFAKDLKDRSDYSRSIASEEFFVD